MLGVSPDRPHQKGVQNAPLDKQEVGKWGHPSVAPSLLRAPRLKLRKGAEEGRQLLQTLMAGSNLAELLPPRQPKLRHPWRTRMDMEHLLASETQSQTER